MKQIRYASVDAAGFVVRTGTCVAQDITLQIVGDESTPPEDVISPVIIPPEVEEILDTTHEYRDGGFRRLEE